MSFSAMDFGDIDRDPDGVIFLEVEYSRVSTGVTLSSTAIELFKSDTVAILKQRALDDLDARLITHPDYYNIVFRG